MVNIDEYNIDKDTEAWAILLDYVFWLFTDLQEVILQISLND